MELTRRTALVTGAAVRVGRVIARELAQASANIVVHYHQDADAAQKAVEEFVALGVQSIALQADVSQRDDVEAMFTRIDERFGGLDVLVNNAGVFRRTPFPELTEDDWDFHLDVNLKGTFLCCQAAAKRMIARGEGKIINIADCFGDRPWPGYIPYCVSKAGVETLTRALARRLARDNVQVNAVGPGAVMFPDDYTGEEIAAKLARVPTGRAGGPEDVARVVRFLIEGSDYVTGAMIPVDGGSSLV